MNDGNRYDWLDLVLIIGFVAFCLLMFGGCASAPDPRIHLDENDELIVSRSTHRTSHGTHIDDYTCRPLVMICDNRGTELVCYCDYVSFE